MSVLLVTWYMRYWNCPRWGKLHKLELTKPGWRYLSSFIHSCICVCVYKIYVYTGKFVEMWKYIVESIIACVVNTCIYTHMSVLFHWHMSKNLHAHIIIIIIIIKTTTAKSDISPRQRGVAAFELRIRLFWLRSIYEYVTKLLL